MPAAELGLGAQAACHGPPAIAPSRSPPVIPPPRALGRMRVALQNLHYKQSRPRRIWLKMYVQGALQPAALCFTPWPFVGLGWYFLVVHARHALVTPVA